MPLNPLAAVTDYQSMLNRIFWFTTAFALGAIWMLRLHVPELDALLSRIDFDVALKGDKLLPAPGGYLLPALAIGIATRVFRLHARISDWLGIRECFDLEVIIGQMADRLGVDLEPIGKDQLRRARHSIMRKAFYPYVSGSQPQVDQQLILQALDAWSWFWVGVEGALLFAVTGLGLIAFNAYAVGFQTLGAALAVAAFGLPAIRNQCKRYAFAQVRAILADPMRAAVVRSAFAEWRGERDERNDRRLAA
jgi:hypothetical protein